MKECRICNIKYKNDKYAYCPNCGKRLEKMCITNTEKTKKIKVTVSAVKDFRPRQIEVEVAKVENQKKSPIKVVVREVKAYKEKDN